MIKLLALTLFFFPSGILYSDKTEEDNMREAVFRYMFEHEASQQKPYTKSLFIGLGKVGEGLDPNDEFMKRFEKDVPTVKKMSQSTTSSSGMAIDRQTGEAGIRYSIGQIKWINDNEAAVEAGYFVAGLFAGGCEYRVVREDKKWVVKGCGDKRWVS